MQIHIHCSPPNHTTATKLTSGNKYTLHENVTSPASPAFRHEHTMLQKDQPKTSAYHLPSTTLSNFFFLPSRLHQPRYWVVLSTKPWTTPSDLHKWWQLTDDLPGKVCVYSPFSRRFRDARWTRSPQWARGFIQTACHIAMVTCPPSSHLFPHSHDSVQIIRKQVAVVMMPSVTASQQFIPHMIGSHPTSEPILAYILQ